MYQMKIKLVWSIYFIAAGSHPEPQSCQTLLSVCIISFPTSPIFKGTTVFLSRHLAERTDGRMKWSEACEGRSCLRGSGWMAGWWEPLGGPCRHAPVDFDVSKACGRQPGKFRYTHPVIDYSAASQKDTAWRGLTAIVSFCCLWGWEARKCGAKMPPLGHGGKKSSSWGNLLFRYLQTSVFHLV